MAIYRLARGGNRAGKTLAVGVEFARALTRQDPYHKYPPSGRAIITGRDLLDVSKVVYRKLFKPGAIKIIKDERTGEWRAYDPRTDFEREANAQDAPPLIPRRFYDPKRISWENKKEEIPRTVPLKTGWELTFFSAMGDPPQGWDVDLIGLDEEIPNPKWFSEIVARIVDRRGRVVWSATAQVGTPRLFELSKRAEELSAASDPNPRVTEHLLNIFMNPFIAKVDRENFIADLQADSDDEYRVRGLGEFAQLGLRIYPEFSKTGVHRVAAFPIPEDWTRYVAIDPGRQVAASLFIAVPPPHHPEHDRPIVYGHLYIRKCNAVIFATKMKEFIRDDHVQGWIIDHQYSQQVEAASGLSIEEQYSTELVRAGCRDNGFTGFIWGQSKVELGILACKAKLQLRNGKPEWLFMTDNLYWFLWELERYLDQKDPRSNVISDRPLGNQSHTLDCWRYLALHDLRYRKPPPKKRRAGWTTAFIKAKKKRHAKESGWGDSIRLG